MPDPSKAEFRLIDNNFLLNNGTLLEWLKEQAHSAKKLNIASAFFYNLVTPEEPDPCLFEYLARENPAIEINLVISDHLSPDLVSTLRAWVNHEELPSPHDRESKFLEILRKTNIKIFIITQDAGNNSRFFHPKLYVLHDGRGPVAYSIGSGNLTPSGLTRNVELMLCDTEPQRCLAFQMWFDTLLQKARPLSAEILATIKPISTEDAKASCEVTRITEPEMTTPKVPIRRIELPREPSGLDISVTTTENSHVLRIAGVDYYESTSGTVYNIDADKILAWCIGHVDSEGHFSPMRFAKIASDPTIAGFFQVYGTSDPKDWLTDFQSNYPRVGREREMTIEVGIIEITIQVLTEIGILFQGNVPLGS